MNLKICLKLAGASLGCALLLSMGAAQDVRTGAASEGATQTTRARTASRARPLVPRAGAYDAKRETVLEGTVASYTESSQTAPIGAHAMVQTANGSVDVHLGPASYLHGNNFSLAAGEAVKFAGVSTTVNGGTVFLARTAQKGSQVLAIRSRTGSLLAIGAVRALPESQRAQMKAQGGAR